MVPQLPKLVDFQTILCLCRVNGWQLVPVHSQACLSPCGFSKLSRCPCDAGRSLPAHNVTGITGRKPARPKERFPGGQH